MKHHNARELTGLRFGLLVAIEYAGSDGKQSLWLTRCDCGAYRTVKAFNLTQGLSNSCGCNTRKAMSDALRKHGMSNTPAYRVWMNMKDRCTNNKNRCWPRYGGRGITVCRKWMESFEAFWQDMGASYTPGLQLDRIDNAMGYSANNCRWVTASVNCNNRRSCTLINSPWGELTIKQASELSGVPYGALLYRVQKGWESESLFQPIGARRNK